MTENNIKKYYLVSILVPIYNVENYIKRCVISLMEQTYENIEYIIVDDCSTDNSFLLLQKTVNEYPKRKQNITIIRNKYNKGIATVRNIAIKNATGDFIINVDSDDWIEKDLVEKCVESQIENSSEIVCYGYVIHSKKCHYFTPHFLDRSDLIKKYLRGDIQVSLWSKMIKRLLFIDNDIKMINGANMGEDYDIVPKLFYYANKISFIKDKLYHYNCESVASYTNVFKETNADQNWANIMDIYSFFYKNDVSYLEDVEIMAVKILNTNILNSARTNNYKLYLPILEDRLKFVNPKYWKKIPLQYRIVFYIKNFLLIRIYSLLMQKIKKYMHF